MSSFVLIIFVLVAAAVTGLQVLRIRDDRKAYRVWRNLEGMARANAQRFSPSMVEGLPEPARRYFEFSIAPETPLRTVVEIEMTGQLGLGSKENPNYSPMRARQILAPPHGLVWNLNTGRGLMRISGSDGFDGQTSWVRFWLLKLIPVVRVGGNADHARAAFGRVVAESVFWCPAALLPQEGVVWEEIAPDTAQATVSFNGMKQTVDVTVSEDGQPVKVVIPRWSDANPEKEYREQPFGGYLNAFRDFGGYTLATYVEGGNFIDSDDYFPFYKATVERLDFVGTEQAI